jgi:hypothetical protein
MATSDYLKKYLSGPPKPAAAKQRPKGALKGSKVTIRDDEDSIWASRPNTGDNDDGDDRPALFDPEEAARQNAFRGRSTFQVVDPGSEGELRA